MTSRSSMSLHRSGQPITCRPGTYRHSKEESACIVCPRGLYSLVHFSNSFFSSLRRLNMFVHVIFVVGHYCVGGVAVPCPAGTYGSKEGLQRLRDCTICPAGRVSIVAKFRSEDMQNHFTKPINIPKLLQFLKPNKPAVFNHCFIYLYHICYNLQKMFSLSINTFL